MKVIDISKHQLAFNAKTTAAYGADAVIIRLAYAGSRDRLACSWAPQILQNGLKLGGYGFATWHYKSVCDGDIYKARQAMKKQVNAWIEAARDTGVNWWFGIDQELENGQKMSLSMDDNTKLLSEAAEMIRAAGFSPCLYCSVAWDCAYIRTTGLPAWLPYWFAYYPTKLKTADFTQATMENLPDGIYSRWMKKVYNAGRLCGWQYDSTSWGSMLGCGSHNVDRDVFYYDPKREQPAYVELHSITTGKMSLGDLEAVEAVLRARDIEYTVTE